MSTNVSPFPKLESAFTANSPKKAASTVSVNVAKGRKAGRKAAGRTVQNVTASLIITELTK